MSAEGRGTSPLPRSHAFDFERLERSVEYLLDEHRRLASEREALLAELADREHRIASLETRLADERRRRASAVEGIDRMLARVMALETHDLDGESRAR